MKMDITLEDMCAQCKRGRDALGHGSGGTITQRIGGPSKIEIPVDDNGLPTARGLCRVCGMRPKE